MKEILKPEAENLKMELLNIADSKRRRRALIALKDLYALADLEV
jgi:hypothetical protein